MFVSMVPRSHLVSAIMLVDLLMLVLVLVVLVDVGRFWWVVVLHIGVLLVVLVDVGLLIVVVSFALLDFGW